MAEKEADKDLLIEVAVAAAAGGMTGGPLGAAAGAGSPLAIEAIKRIRDRKRETADHALAETGLAPEELLERILADDRLLTLAQTVFRAATRASFETKRRALGRVLANAVLDEALVDESEMLARTIEILEPVHVQALAIIGNPPMHQGFREPRLYEPEFRERFARAEGLVSGVLAVLQSQGLITWDVTTGIDGGGKRLELTEYGSKTLAVIQE